MDHASEGYTGESARMPARMRANAERVRRGFWPKLRRVASRIPFAQDLLAAYYCAADPATPFRVRATLLGALAYFVLPTDAIPDFLALVGFTDDAAVLMGALTMVSTHITPRHRAQAAEALADVETADAA